eukprot:gb/GECG01001946.1/.p1 GENE.gb/GECG01001946.1/~~gb/GECG01001946.1/.p1  ORF type:complete len:173 (+),score=37.52 gb/GECG01001946.1/:1-519(+)
MERVDVNEEDSLDRFLEDEEDNFCQVPSPLPFEEDEVPPHVETVDIEAAPEGSGESQQPPQSSTAHSGSSSASSRHPIAPFQSSRSSTVPHHSSSARSKSSKSSSVPFQSSSAPQSSRSSSAILQSFRSSKAPFQSSSAPSQSSLLPSQSFSALLAVPVRLFNLLVPTMLST